MDEKLPENQVQGRIPEKKDSGPLHLPDLSYYFLAAKILDLRE